MNNKRKKILLIFLVLLIIGSVFFSRTDFFNKLLGNIFSVKVGTKEVFNNNVVLDANKLYDTDTSLKLKIYNGSNKDIMITHDIIKNGYCKSSEEPCDYTEKETDYTLIKSGEEKEYDFSDINLLNSDLSRVGIKYSAIDEDAEYYLYTYVINKSTFNIDVQGTNELYTTFQNSINKLDLNETDVKESSWLDYLATLYNAKNILTSSNGVYLKMNSFEDDKVETEITEEEISSITNELNTKNIELKDKANYDEYNELVNKISSINSSWFSQEDYNKFLTIYNEKSNYENLSEDYQIKVDNYVKRLDSALDDLMDTVPNADYSAVMEAINSANSIHNKTDNGKYKLYKDEAWDNLQNAISSVKYDLKVYEQDIVDGYAASINSAIAFLEQNYAPAHYEEVNRLISIYRDNSAYENNWYTENTKNQVDEYINNIDFNYDIRNQSIVDTYAEELTPLIDSLELKDAKGYKKTDDYQAFDGALSLEEYKSLILALDENNYTASSIDKLNELKDELSNPNNEKYDYIYNIKINEQDELDDLLRKLHSALYGDYLEKKSGDYSYVCAYFMEALSLDLNIYEDTKDVQKAVFDVDWDLKIDEQDKIEEEKEKLQTALDSLVKKKANYEEFDEIYNVVISLNPDNYIDFTDMQFAIDLANESKDIKIDEQERVDEVTNVMKNAYESLVYKDADYSKLKEVISKIPQDYSKYPSDVQEKIKDYIKEVEELPKDLKIIDQEKIDELVKKGEDLITSLPDIKPDNNSNSNNTTNDTSNSSSNNHSRDNNSNHNNKKTTIKQIIKSIKVNGKDVDLTKEPFSITVSKSTTNANVEVYLVDEESTYEVYGGSVLFEGQNTIRIVVTTKDKETYIYKLSVIKEGSSKSFIKPRLSIQKDNNKYIWILPILLLIVIIINVILIVKKKDKSDYDDKEHYYE